MMYSLVTAVIMCFLLAGFAYLAIWSRRPTYLRTLSIITLPIGLVISILLATLPLGHPTKCIFGLTIPKGQYAVLGMKIIKDDKIFLFLDSGKEPLSCYIPYSNETASKLQETFNEFGSGEISGEGSIGDAFTESEQPITVHEPPVEANPPKQQDQPTFWE